MSGTEPGDAKNFGKGGDRKKIAEGPASQRIPAAPTCHGKVMILAWVTRSMGEVYSMYAYRCEQCKKIVRLQGIPINKETSDEGRTV